VPYSAELQMVDDHIAQGERHVAQQVELIARLRGQGLPTEMAEQLLGTFELTLRQHRDHRTRLVDSTRRELPLP
jgi:hypothetical protein